jgi:hypothetical protein
VFEGVLLLDFGCDFPYGSNKIYSLCVINYSRLVFVCVTSFHVTGCSCLGIALTSLLR